MSEERNNPSTEATKTVVIHRIFDAPRDLVFETWTNPEYLLLWFAPRGCTIHFSKIDVRPGGSFLSCIHNPSFGDCWCLGAYEEIVRPERLIYTMAVADKDGNKVTSSQAGHDSKWPEETRVIVTFDDFNGKTKLTLRQNVLESLAKRTGAYPSWIEMLDRLAEILQKRGGGVHG